MPDTVRNVVRGRRRALALAAVLALWTHGAGATADALRCGNKIVQRGDPAAKLQRFCGKPETVSKWLGQRAVYHHRTNSYVYYPGFLEEVWIEDWTYNFGPNRMMRVVRVEGGFVADVKQLGYGY